MNNNNDVFTYLVMIVHLLRLVNYRSTPNLQMRITDTGIFRIDLRNLEDRNSSSILRHSTHYEATIARSHFEIRHRSRCRGNECTSTTQRVRCKEDSLLSPRARKTVSRRWENREKRGTDSSTNRSSRRVLQSTRTRESQSRDYR